MNKLKNCACFALQDLAVQIAQGFDWAWQRADKIERRFRMQGYTLALVDAHKAKAKQFQLDQRRKHDRQFPDRLTYLWR